MSISTPIQTLHALSTFTCQAPVLKAVSGVLTSHLILTHRCDQSAATPIAVPKMILVRRSQPHRAVQLPSQRHALLPKPYQNCRAQPRAGR